MLEVGLVNDDATHEYLDLLPPGSQSVGKVVKILEGFVVENHLGGKLLLEGRPLGDIEEFIKKAVEILKISLSVNRAGTLISGVVIISKEGVKGLVEGGPVNVIAMVMPVQDAGSLDEVSVLSPHRLCF